MKKTTRRKFIGQGAVALGAAIGIAQLPEWVKAQTAAMDIPLGFQTFPIRDRLGKDFAGTLKTMAGFGYRLVEMCSPAGYAEIGFGFLKDKSPQEIRSVINDAGLQCPSCHFGFGELAPDKIDKTIEFAHQLGLSQMICSTFWLPKGSTLKDYTDAADKLNKAASTIKSAGMQAGFHNHEFEFATLDGSLIYDALMQTFDPSLVKMQFQTEVINLGYKAETYFEKYPGRFISSHLSDWTADKKEVPIGKGVIDWAAFFHAAKTGGVKNFFVEMQWETFQDSATFIKQL
ncbi:sugar phosphate isomerase/epimerase family protein [Puia dinghuensis]|uniref:Xylose isomerase n=1 Tax=Puia dinghuensis TaxID=1792502 RepID=A0A8J2UCU5_9BACT|nr:TIM barrel protein [Puia dinghuensis]GGA97027.1 xylose isomerase [Puia dinghuensis]